MTDEEREKIKRLSQERRELQRVCGDEGHIGWNFDKDGRCCRKCGMMLVAFGNYQGD